jgi:hypothetical protein
MRLSALLVTISLLAGVVPLHSQSDETLAPGETAQILTQILSTRQVVRDSAAISACSLFRGLGESRAAIEQLPPWVRTRLVGEARPGCADGAEQARGPHPVWRLRHITVETGMKVIVRATVASRGQYHHEAYVVRRDAAPGPQPWYVDEITLSEFVQSDAPPPPPPSP